MRTATGFGILDHIQVLDHRGAPSLLSFHAAVSAYVAPAACYCSYKNNLAFFFLFLEIYSQVVLSLPMASNVLVVV